jgi:hypothetical protein
VISLWLTFVLWKLPSHQDISDSIFYSDKKKGGSSCWSDMECELNCLCNKSVTVTLLGAWILLKVSHPDLCLLINSLVWFHNKLIHLRNCLCDIYCWHYSMVAAKLKCSWPSAESQPAYNSTFKFIPTLNPKLTFIILTHRIWCGHLNSSTYSCTTAVRCSYLNAPYTHVDAYNYSPTS